MSKIIVSGLVNFETTCKTDNFPIEYAPVSYNFFGVNSTPSGVGLNVSYALKALGDDVSLFSFVGDDHEGKIVKEDILAHGISTEHLEISKETASSVILYDDTGKRRIYCDLKDMQELNLQRDKFFEEVKESDAVVLCNINFSREMIRVALGMNKLIATDVHCIYDINDEYNKEFMEYANVLFLSNENIIGNEKKFVGMLSSKYSNCDVIVCGMGEKGALLYSKVKDDFFFVDAYKGYEVVNTSGAGDALFSSFLHFYVKGEDEVEALKKAVKFAAYKISYKSSSEGFLKENEV